MTFELVGADRLATTLAGVAAGLGDLRGTQARMGALVQSAAEQEAPRRTGALAAAFGVQVSESAYELVNAASYAGPVHWGHPARNIAPNPVGIRAVERTTDAQLDVLVDDVNKLLSTVKGA